MEISTRSERLLAGVAAALLTLPTLHTDGFCLDDSFIHLAYVASLRLGDGLSYNPGDWETGVSSPLWVLLLSLWPPGVPTVAVVKSLGAVLHAASAMLAVATARALVTSPAPGLGLLAGLGVAATPLLVQGATSGMEVPLATLLSLAMTLALARERHGLAALAAFAAYLARPELLGYALALSAGAFALRRERRVLACGAGALLGLVAFGAYCMAVSGHLFPNTYYVKGGSLSLGGLAYLALEVMPHQPVVASLTGIVLIVVGVRSALANREHLLPLVLAAGLATLLAIAVSRALYPGVLFFQSRYFAVLLWVLPLAAALGFARLGRAPAWALLAPMVAASGWLLWQGQELQLAQERGVRRLHVEVAARVIHELPRDAVLGVEGAGALRFHTPRTIRVVDLLGLNDGQVAHMGGTLFLKLCHFRAVGGSHLAYPAQWRDTVHRAFVLEDLATFTEHAYAQLDPPTAWQVTLAQVVAPQADFAAFCHSKGL